MGKPPSIKLPSGDFELVVDGVTYKPHEGEWIEASRMQRIGEVVSISQLSRLGVELQALAGDEDEQARMADLMEKHFEDICRVLAERVIAWNWTNDQGNAYPPPSRDAFQLLRAEELYYLLRVIQGEGPGEQKNGSRPSETTSSATALPRSRK